MLNHYNEHFFIRLPNAVLVLQHMEVDGGFTGNQTFDKVLTEGQKKFLNRYIS